MYQNFETPVITANILYFDKNYDRNTSENVLLQLERHNLFPPSRFRAERLTRGRMIKYRPEHRNVLIDAYCEKGVEAVCWRTQKNVNTNMYCDGYWMFTFYKRRHIINTPQYEPWNVLKLSATYEWLGKDDYNTQFFQCIKSLIPILHPSVILIDDTANMVNLRHSVSENRVVTDRIQQVYWGNYWSDGLCNKLDMSRILNMDLFDIEEIDGGVYFQLTDSVFSFSSELCKKNRNLILREVLNNL